MNLLVNMLIEWAAAPAAGRIERVLWIDPLGDDVVTIDITDRQALPVWQQRSEIEAALATGQARVLEVDPYVHLFRPEDTIADKHRLRRERSWQVIAPLIANGVDIFIPAKRGALVVAAVQRTGRSRKTIYLALRRYWQRGQTKNALLPGFDRCGAKGQTKSISDRKRGRPAKLAVKTGQPTGLNVNPEVREKILRGMTLFYEQRGGTSLVRARQLTLENLFNKGYQLRNGVWVPVLPPAEELPTLDQFRYWYKKERSLVRTITSRQGTRRFETTYRPVLGDSTQMAFGPGSIYQIDATIGDIYLVSSRDRSRIIGRPVIYTIMDVFSRLIAGMSVSLEGPSWLSAMLALENATMNKVAFCAEYGISITEDEWPSYYLPEAILADRGEFEGYQADHLVNAFNIHMMNTAPYRGDWKGIVERNFRLSNDTLIRWLPGAVYKPRERGGLDYRLDACLNLYEFRQLMIRCVLYHNNHYRMDWYRMDEFMITDHVKPYPIELWQWGVQNRSGHLRSLAPEAIRLNLLPTKEASVGREGIRFQGLHYTSSLAVQEEWFVKARVKGTWRVPVAYDPRITDVIYLRLEDGQRIEPCYLLDKDKTFQGRDWYESLDYFELQKQAQQSARTRQQQTEAEFHAQIEQIVTPAREQAKQARAGQSKRSRLLRIRENRQEERQRERQDGARSFPADETRGQPATGGGPRENLAAEHEYVPPSRPIDQLRKLRQEKLNHE